MRRPVTAATLAIAVVLGVGAIAFAQARGGKGVRGAAEAKPEHVPILTRSEVNKRDWTIITEVKLYGFKSLLFADSPMLGTNTIRVDSASTVFPLIRNSSMHDVHAEDVQSGYYVDKKLVNSDPRILPDYQGPTDLLVWNTGPFDALHTHLHIEIPVTSYETRIDEERAFAVPWFPEDQEWAPHIAANLEPQLFIEPDAPAVRRLVREWTRGKPRKAGYYELAKYLAGKVVEHYQPEGRILEASGRGDTLLAISAILVSGFRVDGAAHAAETGKGSPLDMANLLTAVYRSVGIPARLVIAHDVAASVKLDSLVVRAWTEFYLYDVRTGVGEWIPVDIQRQRAFSSRMPPLRQRWQFFGHNEQFEFAAPIAHHWHPPTSVTNQGPPALWGWITTPAQPIADQGIRIDTIGTPKRGDGKPARPIPSR